MVEAQATARGIRTSAQKAGLVCALIRGKSVNQALATLQFTRKIIARELAKVLRSAVANLQQKEGFGGDIDRLYVSACFANQGMSMKRVRPAPMGRAYRVVKRTAHLTVKITERPLAIAKVGTEGGGEAATARKSTRAAKTQAAAARGAKKAAASA
jgi:large subunit ribosomal protein L22